MRTADLTPELEEVILASKARFQPWIVCITAGLLFFYEFIQLNMLNSLSSYLMADFHLDATALGHLSSTYFYANASLVFVAGALLDRFSTRRLILFAMISCTLGTLGFALSHSVYLLGVCRFIVGVGGAFCFLSCMRLATRWFHPMHLALVVGLIVTMAMLGGMVAQTPLAALSQSVGWRQAVLWDAALGGVISLLILIVVKDYPPGADARKLQQKEQISALGLWPSIKMAISNIQNWLCAIYSATMNLPIYLLGALWGNSYLQQVLHYSATEAATICSMIYFGTVFGSPFSGWVSDRLQNRRKPMIAGALISLALVLLIIYGPHFSVPVYMGLFFLLGLVTSTQVISYPMVAEKNPTIITGTSVAIVSLTIVLSGAWLQPLFGWIMDLTGPHQIINHVPIYSAHAYHYALLLLPAMFILSLLSVLAVDETNCQQQK